MNDGGPAFPLKILKERSWDPGDIGSIGSLPGMSLRDFGAFMAMHAILSGDPTIFGLTKDETKKSYEENLASKAFAYADAMLKEREKYK